MSYTKVVTATESALTLIGLLQAEYGTVLFHQSGGCCGGSTPMCYLANEFRVGERDVHLGQVGGADVYVNGDLFEYWKLTQLVIDVTLGQGGMFSLENGTGKRFVTRGGGSENGELRG